MHQGVRLEMYLWENLWRRQRAEREKRWQDPEYHKERQARLDRGKLLGQIYLGVGILVGISYVFFP